MNGKEDGAAPVPFVTTTLDVRWLPASLAAIAGTSIYLGDNPLPFYRVTPTVAAWFSRKMLEAEQRAELWAALASSGAVAVFLRLANWADEEYGEEAISTATPTLPRLEKLPPKDVPPVDPLVWSGAFDNVKVERRGVAPTVGSEGDVGGQAIVISTEPETSAPWPTKALDRSGDLWRPVWA